MTKGSITKASDPQRHAFLLTINNPMDHGIDHTEIKKCLIENFTTVEYFCMSDEVGEKGTPHIHLYVYFNSRVRFSTVKKYFPSAHIDIALGAPQNNISYVKKSGKWKDTEKAETSIEGTFEEWGNEPFPKGKNTLMQELYRMVVDDGLSNAEILSENPDYIPYLTSIDRLRTTMLTEKYKNTRRLNLHVVYICGRTGSGKTRGVLDQYGDSAVYKVNDYEHPFDSYACQPVMCFDEFRSQLRISDMLCYLDIYPVELPARYANKVMCAETIFFTSNLNLEEQYPNIRADDPETWRAFLRRIHEVRTYEQDGTITIYESVEKYLNRSSEFHKATKEELEDLPFKDQKGDDKE